MKHKVDRTTKLTRNNPRICRLFSHADHLPIGTAPKKALTLRPPPPRLGPHASLESCAQYRSDAVEPALRGENPLWQRVPVTDGTRQKALSDARWSGRIRCAQRQSKCVKARPVPAMFIDTIAHQISDRIQDT
jgi:hypothetical protein